MNHRIRGGWTLLYPVLYQVRFAVLAAAAVLLGNYLVLQVQLVVTSTIVIMAVLGLLHPIQEVRKNYAEIANEVVIIFIMDLLMFSSDTNLPPSNRSLIGFCMIAVLLLSMLYNYGSILLHLARRVRLRCKLQLIRCRVRARQKKLNELQRNLSRFRHRLSNKDNKVDGGEESEEAGVGAR